MSVPIPVGRSSSYWDEETVIAILQAWARKHGRPPSAAAWQRSDGQHPCTGTVRQLFGSWNAGLTAAGLTPPKPQTMPRHYSNEQILAAIRQAFAAGERTSRPFIDGRRRPYLAVIACRFGSWNAAVAAAGVLSEQRGYRPEVWDKDWLRQKYLVEGLGIRRIAALLGCSTSVVWRALERADIPRRPRGRVLAGRP